MKNKQKKSMLTTNSWFLLVKLVWATRKAEALVEKVNAHPQY
jgi:hypothetical protein